uniref:CCHC-type domain-containing protein n=2 Tax=Clastoptera arizonana TaxID=38151 RepID=A0A1B6DCT3_9HEMI
MSIEDTLKSSIFLGEVASVQNYGAFIKIPGNRNQGLVHRSQVSKVAVDDVTEVLQRGERVWCKVIKITDDNKIALSMKVVDQGNGQDLDPNGVLIHQEELKRKSNSGQSGRKVIELEAVLNTTCTKCGTKGHLSKDCFQSRDGKKYELITEEEIADLIKQPEEQLCNNDDNKNKIKTCKTSSKKRKKEKKLKKKSKKKRKYLTTSSSSSESSSNSEPSYHQKKKRLKSSRQKKNDNFTKNVVDF